MSSGYTRQSAAGIVTGAVILASGLNAEYNQLVSAFDNSSGHVHDGTVAGSGAPLNTASLSGLNNSSVGFVRASGSNTFTASAIVAGDIASSTITYAKIQNVAASSLLGNPTGFSAVLSEITLNPALAFSGTTLTIATAGVTSAMLAGSIAASKLVGTDITTVGTITSGTWHGTAIANANLANTAVANLSGINTGDQTNITGNAATVTTNANLTGPIISVGNTTSVAAQTGTGSTFVMNSSPTLITPVLGVATATSINGLTLTASTGTLSITNLKTLAASNSLTFAGTDGTTITFQATGTYVSRTSTDTLTNKTFDTAGTGNSFSINGTAITAVTGTGSVVLAASPTLTGTPLAPTATGGTNTTQIATTAFVTAAVAAGAVAPTFLWVREEQTSGTSPQTLSAAWTKRTLNTTKTNTITSATLTSSVISLPAGTYTIKVASPVDASAILGKCRLQNTTDSTTIALGTNCYSSIAAGGSCILNSLIDGVFTIAGTKNLEIQHYDTNSSAGGVAVSIAAINEVYTEVFITKVA